MEMQTIYLMLTILKVVIVIGGMAFTLSRFFPGIARKDKRKIRQAAVFFVITWLLIVIITGVEFIIAVK